MQLPQLPHDEENSVETTVTNGQGTACSRGFSCFILAADEFHLNRHGLLACVSTWTRGGLPISWPVSAGSCPSLSPSPPVTQQTSTLINPPLPNSSCISMNCLLFRPLWKFWNSCGASQASEAILTPTYLHMSIWIFLLCGIRHSLRANISNQYWNKRTVLAYAGLSRKAGLLSKLLLMKPLCVLCKSMVILTLSKDPYVFVLLTWHSHGKT